MTKQVMSNKAKERYTGLSYTSLIDTTEEPSKAREETPEGYRKNPAYIEKRTRRVQLVFQPSLYEKVEQKYKALGYRSCNDYIHSILEAEISKEN